MVRKSMKQMKWKQHKAQAQQQQQNNNNNNKEKVKGKTITKTKKIIKQSHAQQQQQQNPQQYVTPQQHMSHNDSNQHQNECDYEHEHLISQQQSESIDIINKNKNINNDNTKNNIEDMSRTVLSQKNKKLLQFLPILNSTQQQPYLREQQQQQLHNFLMIQPTLSSNNSNININNCKRVISVCGVAGTGKTTTVMSILKKHYNNSTNNNNNRLKYKYVNCLNLVQNEQNMIKSIVKWAKCQELYNQGKDMSVRLAVVVLDQCDCLSNLAHTVSQLLDMLSSTQPTTICKLILISNRNQLNSNNNYKLGLQQQKIQTILFMPYQDKQIRQILNTKLNKINNRLDGQGASIIPPSIIQQAVRKVSKAGGDYRELQKFISTWIYTQVRKQQQQQQQQKQLNSVKQSKYYNSNINNINNNVHYVSGMHINDPFLQILHKYIYQLGQQHKVLLLHIISTLLQQQQQQQSSKVRNKNKKTLICRCRINTYNKITNKCHTTKLKLLAYMRQLQQMGIIKMKKGKCGWHQRQVLLADVKGKDGLDLGVVKQIIVQALGWGMDKIMGIGINKQ